VRDHPDLQQSSTIEEVVARVRAHIPDVVVIDDGSAEPARQVVQQLADTHRCEVVFRPHNGGKGAAVKTGLAWAHEHHYDYALQIDADLQHNTDDIPKLIAAVGEAPTKETLVLAQPVFDASAPQGTAARASDHGVFAMVETLGRKVGDPLCGYRIYPVEAALRVKARGDAMDFDPEIAVRLVWEGSRSCTSRRR